MLGGDETSSVGVFRPNIWVGCVVSSRRRAKPGEQGTVSIPNSSGSSRIGWRATVGVLGRLLECRMGSGEELRAIISVPDRGVGWKAISWVYCGIHGPFGGVSRSLRSQQRRRGLVAALINSSLRREHGESVEREVRW